MAPRSHALTRIVSVACAGAMTIAACSDSSGTATPDTTIVRASTTTTLVPDTPTGGQDPTTASATTSSVPETFVEGLPLGVVFPDISVIDPLLSMQALAAGDLDRLDARFRQDERVDVFLEEVDARGVYEDGQLVAVAVGVAVTPGAASTSGFVQSFVQGATEGGVVNEETVRVLDQELTVWTSEGTGHLLWSHQNLFLIVSGRNPLQVRDISEAIVTMVLSPPRPTTTVAELPPCPDESATSTTADADVEADPEADGEGDGDAGSGETAEPCVPVEGSTTSTEAGE